MQYLRSLLFTIQAYFAMAVLGLVFAPYAALSPIGARRACQTYCIWVKWTMRWLVGIRYEVRGTPPQGEVLIAAKHQSFLDIMLIFHALPAPKFIMKRELLWTPIIGLYAKRLGCVPVSRGKRGAAIQKMVRDVEAGRAQPGQLVIYPQGTRVAPGVKVPYKVGTAILYEELGQPCVPVAANAGLFWPRKGVMRHPGTAVVEFLPEIPTGLDRATFMARVEDIVEHRSDALMAEAGFEADAVH
ncbi:MAG: lysophospholipid acyltransferase family protein [Pseudomonadota bacterium]